jgi:uncharacterized protein (DUF2141 family)
MKALCFFLAILPAIAAADTLTVNVSGVKPGKGDVRVGIFKGPEEFPEGSYFKGIAVPGDAQTMRIEVEDLEPGQYAISVFQDIDGTEKLNKNFVGMPKEPYGFSGNWKSGGASFKDALINLEANGSEISIKMK